MNTQKNKNVLRNSKLGLSLFAIMFISQSSAYAENVDAQAVFSGTIPDACTVTVTAAGSLGASNDATVLSSAETGGSDATANIVTNSSASTIQIINPVAFTTAPAGSDANTTFASNYVLTGSTTATEADGTTSTTLSTGSTSMTLGANATKSSGSYNAGNYSFTTTVRCVVP